MTINMAAVYILAQGQKRDPIPSLKFLSHTVFICILIVNFSEHHYLGLRSFILVCLTLMKYSYLQVKYSTRWQTGYGLTDGENMERLWAFLRRFAFISKEMTSAHRIDLLTDALLHYRRKKILEMGKVQPQNLILHCWISVIPVNPSYMLRHAKEDTKSRINNKINIAAIYSLCYWFVSYHINLSFKIRLVHKKSKA